MDNTIGNIIREAFIVNGYSKATSIAIASAAKHAKNSQYLGEHAQAQKEAAEKWQNCAKEWKENSEEWQAYARELEAEIKNQKNAHPKYNDLIQKVYEFSSYIEKLEEGRDFLAARLQSSEKALSYLLKRVELYISVAELLATKAPLSQSEKEALLGLQKLTLEELKVMQDKFDIS